MSQSQQVIPFPDKKTKKYNGSVNHIAENLRRINHSLGRTGKQAVAFVKQCDEVCRKMTDQIETLRKQNEQTRKLSERATKEITELEKIEAVDVDDLDHLEKEEGAVGEAAKNLRSIHIDTREQMARLGAYVERCGLEVADRETMIETLRGQIDTINKLKLKAKDHLEVMRSLNLPDPRKEKSEIDLRSPFPSILHLGNQTLQKMPKVRKIKTNVKVDPVDIAPREDV